MTTTATSLNDKCHGWQDSHQTPEEDTVRHDARETISLRRVDATAIESILLGIHQYTAIPQNNA